jgi:hypothetical protein
MSDLALIILDLAAISVLAFGLYFPRHRRKDMVGAFVGVNIGVLAVAEALLASTVTAGLGLGLFGVLSIIRLRSRQLEQHEVAYYFAALALGLLGGLARTATWVTPALMLLILVGLYVSDHPALGLPPSSQLARPDRAWHRRDVCLARRCRLPVWTTTVGGCGNRALVLGSSLWR